MVHLGPLNYTPVTLRGIFGPWRSPTYVGNNYPAPHSSAFSNGGRETSNSGVTWGQGSMLSKKQIIKLSVSLRLLELFYMFSL